MEGIGYAAVGVGESDLALGPVHYLKLAGKASFARLSANLVRASDGSPWMEPYRIVPVGDRKVGVLALTRFNPTLVKSLPEGDTLLVRSPSESAATYVPLIRDQVDLVVLLASMPMDDARLLVRRVEGIDVVLGASAHDLTAGVPAREGATHLIYTGHQGQDLAEVRVHYLDGGRFSIEMHMHHLDRGYPEDGELAETVRQTILEVNSYHRRLAEARRSSQMAAGEGGDAADQNLYGGVDACLSCHPGAVETWYQTRHAFAFETLEEEDSEFNPACVACHVVGHGRPGGFVDALSTPRRKNVQCEACHGPAGEHARAPVVVPDRVRISTCVRCHDSENSPDFNFYTYWPRIRHGGD